MSDHCPECGRTFPDGGRDDPLAVIEDTMEQVRLLAEKWLRSSDSNERMMGADLKQVVSA